MSIERIIMVTGSKGGGGKTPVAASIALSLHQLKIPVAVVDFNFNNSDLYTIFHGTNVLQRRDAGILGAQNIGRDTFHLIDDGFWLTRWHSTMSVGLPSTDSMWSKIEEMVTYEYPRDQPKVLVIDTNLTLPLICPPLNKVRDYILPPVEVYHLWSPAIVLQLDEQQRFAKTIDILNRFSPGFEERLTHIFTPRHHQSTGFFGTLSSLTKGEFNVSKKPKMKQSQPKPISSEEMEEILFADFLPDVLNFQADMQLDIQTLTSMWFKNIIDTLEDRQYLTPNVMLVPTVVHDIALLVEQLSLKPRRTLEIIRQDLGSLFQIMLSHFENYKLPTYNLLSKKSKIVKSEKDSEY